MEPSAQASVSEPSEGTAPATLPSVEPDTPRDSMPKPTTQESDTAPETTPVDISRVDDLMSTPSQVKTEVKSALPRLLPPRDFLVPTRLQVRQSERGAPT